MHNFSFVSSANAPVHPNLAEMLQTKPWRILYVRGPQRKVNNLLSNLAESPCNLQLNKITSDYTSPTLNQTSHAPINSMQNQAEERLAVFGIEPQEITLNYKKLKDVPPLMRARCYVAEFMDSNVAIISFFQMKGLKDRFFIAKRLRAYVDKHELYNIVITCYDKMDAVPGIPTTMWFTPKFTTAEMKEKTGNPNFAYEISCDQICGNGHYSMKGIVEVVTQEEYDMWMAKQKAQYLVAFPEKDPSNVPAATVEAEKASMGAKKTTDSTAKTAVAKM